jgi:hypothetical protein
MKPSGMKFLTISFFTASTFGLSACVKPNKSEVKNAFLENSNTDPVHFERNFFTNTNIAFERRLNELPLSGSISEAWSDTYLPNVWAGAAMRWYGDNNLGNMDKPTHRADMWTYNTHSAAELKQFSIEQLKKLSPAEKFDILLSRYDYPLTALERKRTTVNDQDWEGVCNGWSTAALKYSEPAPVTIVNREGVMVPFASSDIKSLLMLQQYFISSFPRYAILGDRCDSPSHANAIELKQPGALSGHSLDACTDANAGAFHLVVTNMIGRLKKGLVFDVDRDEEVWNQPVYKYESAILLKTAQTARVSTSVWYAEELMPEWLPFIANRKNAVVKATYNYTLELSPEGKIIGGKWLEGTNREGKTDPVYHPDFVWYGDGEQSQYSMQNFETKNGIYRPQLPIDFGAVVDLWAVSAGKTANFRGLAKFN